MRAHGWMRPRANERPRSMRVADRIGHGKFHLCRVKRHEPVDIRCLQLIQENGALFTYGPIHQLRVLIALATHHLPVISVTLQLPPRSNRQECHRQHNQCERKTMLPQHDQRLHHHTHPCPHPSRQNRITARLLSIYDCALNSGD